MKVYIIARDDGCPVHAAVLAELERLGIAACGSPEECGVMITIGGDGTLLQTAAVAGTLGKPLLGINTGRLGFMATLEKDELWKLGRLVTGEYSVSRRMFAEVKIGNKTLMALNDVVLHKRDARLPDFRLCSGGVEIMKIRADGVIVSTPTGSTAYSLSAGGPIIEPEMECFLVTALCPHTLFNRPIVFTPESVLAIGGDSAEVSVDGRLEWTLEPGERVEVAKSRHCLELIDINRGSFFNSLHDKLMKPLK